MAVFLGVDTGDTFFSEDALAGGLNFRFIIGMGIRQDLAELSVVVERFTRGVEFELGAFERETFASESEVLVGVFLVAHPEDPSAQRFELLRSDAR